MRPLTLLLCLCVGYVCAQEFIPPTQEVTTPASEEAQTPPPPTVKKKKKSWPEERWYIEAKPGYYYLMDKLMRQFFDTGGFTVRAETGYRFWKPLAVWLDAGYFKKDGHSIGGSEKLSITLASLTLGLKGIYYLHDAVAVYGGAGPRVFVMLLDNDSPYVRGEDNEIGIGGGFNAGFWFFPIPSWRNVFIDLFADYSLNTMKLEQDEVSSADYNVKVSGLTAGLGLGIRF